MLKKYQFGSKKTPTLKRHRSPRERLLKWGMRILGVFLISFVIGFWLIWVIYLRSLPSIENLIRWDYFRESTIIYDKNGGEIYSLYKDWKRTYISYDEISQSIKDAIISTEDGTFFENPGIDIKWLVRAGLNYIVWTTDRIKWTSTISQQLVRNTLLTNKRSIERKIQEIYLSYKLNNTYTKEEILEMYLNAIAFWSNANWVEQASRTFFWKSAKDVWPLGASILASLPKWPTYYSPYMRRDRLMGFVEVYPASDTADRLTLSSDEDKTTFRPLYNEFKSYLSGMVFESYNEWVWVCNINSDFIKDNSFSPDSKNCINISYDELLPFIWSIAVKEDIVIDEVTTPYIIEYTIWRKDFVAAQMLKEWKIDGATFSKILFDGLDFTFRKYTENIKYPYFVMYIKEYLEWKYGKDLDIASGLKVYTTIDPTLQEKAEELVKKQVDINKKQFGASSAALISMDNTDGKLLAMVGWPDYFDTENGWNNNMTLALRQPGSSFKPFVYTLAISSYPIWPESPVADIETTFWKWKPDNYDRSFKWIMKVENALDYSRNIPAIKMFYLAWWEEKIVEIWKKLWLSSLRENAWYGAPIAIWTAEVRPIDLMQAYSVIANNWLKRDIYFIEKIEDSNGNIIEEQKNKEPIEILSPAASYIVSKILSNNNARPESTFWRNALTIAWRTVAAKTGTSNKDVSTWNGKTKSILPRDLWTVWYTPQITTVVWAWNVNGKETRGTCDWLNCAAPIWKWFMEFALKNLPKVEFEKPKWLYTYNIVKSSGRLARSDTPEDQVVSTIMAVKLDEYDGGLKEVSIDSLCNWPVSENTPPEDIRKIYVPSLAPIIDGFDPTWSSGFFEASRMLLTDDSTGTGTVQQYSTTPCERPSWPGDISLTLKINNSNWKRGTIVAWWIGDRKIRTLRVYQDAEVLKEIVFGTWALENWSFTIDTGIMKIGDVMKVEIVDEFWFKYSESQNVWDTTVIETASWSISWWQDVAPAITMINPKWKQLSIYEWDIFNLRFRTIIGTSTREITIRIDDKVIQTANSGDIFVIPVGSQWLSLGSHTVSISITDGKFRTAESSFILNVLQR
jgi:penicillin-binding protein 1A